MPAGALDAELSDDFAWSNFDDLTQSTNVAEIEHAYRMLELEEARLDVEISESVEGTADVDNSFAQLFDLQAALHAISDQLEPVQSAIDTTATNAGAISGRVRFLDQEQKKLKQALSMIEETALLRHRLVELLAAMRDKNIDIAAALIHKYITTDAPVLDSPFVAFASANGSSEDSSSPRSIIASATKELVDRVSFTFDAAVESNNTKEISHCFRLFPLLGEDLRGLDMYSDFLCKMIAEKSRVTADIQGSSIYAVRLTRLFEVIAVIIDNHFPLVETHYGPGRMVRVIQRLQMEGTKRAAMVLDFFEDERHIKRRIAQIQQAEASQTRPKSYAMAAADHRSKSEDALSDHDFKDITDILGELVLIERQISMFSRFMESRAAPEVKALSLEPGSKDRVFHKPAAILKHLPLAMQGILDTKAGESAHAAVELDEVTGLVVHTPLSLRISWLTDTYITFESFFVSRSATKVMLLDDTDSLSGWAEPIVDASEAEVSKSSSKPSAGLLSGFGQRGWRKPGASAAVAAVAVARGQSDIGQTSSCVGDMFFVAKTALEHAIATQQPAAVEAVSQSVIGVMNSALLATVESRALSKWNAVSGTKSSQLSTVSSELSWRLPGVGSVADTQAEDSPINPVAAHQRGILVSVNNLDLAGQYLQKTADELKTRVTGEWARIPQRDHVTRAQKALDAFGAFLAKFTHAKQRSLEQFGAQVIKPWMRAILQQSYRDIKYVLTDEEFNDVQNDNLFQKRFVLKFGLLVRQLKQRLTAGNLAAALDIAASSLAVDWERAIRQSKFNMLGGIMFEKDVREIQRYLELESDTMLRKKFLRLIQSASVLAVEGVADARHIFDGLSVTDVSPQAALSKSEVKAILANRIDVSEKDISELEP
ncbi:Golgi transport complex subunit 4 [Coemansia sp. RSA 2050]|nr:Golgi transport complex subunit 4 [Coemansia sp. RSA 2050]KAJ2733405.1 Golgi transport complex subunit 4 [Coemansia sp. BCRC 34962]